MDAYRDSKKNNNTDYKPYFIVDNKSVNSNKILKNNIQSSCKIDDSKRNGDVFTSKKILQVKTT